MNKLDPRPGIIVFDMDGTLIDVSDSYREAAPLTAIRYLRLIGLGPPGLTGDVYDIFKRMGGFNDDWDLTAGILEILLARLPLAPPLPPLDSPDPEALICRLQEAAAPLRHAPNSQPDWEPNWDALVEPVRAAGGGLPGLRRLTGGRNAHLVCNSGSPRTTDLVQRLFSEIYLGATRFQACYGFAARFVAGPGLIELERLMISPGVLDALASDGFRLGIATGRTRFEAEQALSMHPLSPYFGAVATMTDAQEAQAAHEVPGHNSYLKPHPFLLHLAADALDPPSRGRMPLRAVYVGDSPDDIVAAQRADGRRPWYSVGLSPPGSALREIQLDLGAHRVLEHPDDLMGLL
jgi:phosphoglycolate phosphatase-like HAD superfamily hydrolase